MRLAALAATSPDGEDLLAGAQVRTQRALSAAARSRAAEQRRPAPRARWAVRPRLAVAAAGALVLVGAVALWRTWPRLGASRRGLHRGSRSRTGRPSRRSGPSAGSGPAQVVVHVVGQVTRPGVVSLPAGSRVMDAVDAAGGATPEADLAGLNLARVLTDGEQVVVPGPGDAAEGVGPARRASTSTAQMPPHWTRCRGSDRCWPSGSCRGGRRTAGSAPSTSSRRSPGSGRR